MTEQEHRALLGASREKVDLIASGEREREGRANYYISRSNQFNVPYILCSPALASIFRTAFSTGCAHCSA